MTGMATPKYKEVWKVKVSTRDEFELDAQQMRNLQERMKAGDLGIVVMKEGGFKISQIVCWYLVSRQIANQLEAPEKDYTLSPEQREKARAKVEEIKRNANWGDAQVK